RAGAANDTPARPGSDGLVLEAARRRGLVNAALDPGRRVADDLLEERAAEAGLQGNVAPGWARGDISVHEQDGAPGCAGSQRPDGAEAVTKRGHRILLDFLGSRSVDPDARLLRP